MATKKSSSKQKLAAAMAEVHTAVPSTVTATGKTGAEKESMLQAIAYSKARAKGARIPKKRASLADY